MFTEATLKKFNKSDLINIILLAQNTNGLAPMDTPSVGTTVIQDFEWTSNNGSKIIKIDGKKFKIYCEYSNGSPLGFNYKKCASVMNEQGSWDYVASIADIEFKNSCWYGDTTDVKKEAAKEFCDTMQEYLEKIYS